MRDGMLDMSRVLSVYIKAIDEYRWRQSHRRSLCPSLTCHAAPSATRSSHWEHEMRVTHIWICGVVIIKSSNLKCHYETKHTACFQNTCPLKPELRPQEINDFIRRWIVTQVRYYHILDLCSVESSLSCHLSVSFVSVINILSGVSPLSKCDKLPRAYEFLKMTVRDKKLEMGLSQYMWKCHCQVQFISLWLWQELIIPYL